MIAAVLNSPFNFGAPPSPPPPGGDPYWEDVVLLLHCDGPTGSTTFVDATGNFTVSAQGGAQVTTTDPKFGTGAMLCASTNRLQMTTSALLNFGTNDFTIEAFVNVSAGYGTGVYSAIVGALTTFGSGVGWGLYVKSTGNIVFCSGIPLNEYGKISVGSWTHVAVSRASGTLRCFINGTQSGSSVTRTESINASPSNLGVGHDFNTGNGYIVGKIDEVRVTKGVARYTSDFTPPTAAFPDS
jgi:hypothetical protein